jgi:hypothetical protein
MTQMEHLPELAARGAGIRKSFCFFFKKKRFLSC